jgi:RHH-type proline utilization regulon transcriptional repressor/proline dehydrogenase/delta 1-pyrroline-5-carboxylate dehydrogenase
MIPKIDVLRYAAPERVSEKVIKASAKKGFYIAKNRVSMHGDVELLNYFYEQSISNNFHRYGNLGARANAYE